MSEDTHLDRASTPVPSLHARFRSRRGWRTSASVQVFGHAGGLRECLLIGVDRKSSAHSQNGAFDPKPTWRFRQGALDGRSFLARLPVRAWLE